MKSNKLTKDMFEGATIWMIKAIDMLMRHRRQIKMLQTMKIMPCLLIKQRAESPPSLLTLTTTEDLFVANPMEDLEDQNLPTESSRD